MKTQILKYAVLRPMLKIVPFSFMRRIANSELVIFYYHIVNDANVPHICHLYKHKGIREFVDDLEFVLMHYTPVGLTNVIRFVQGGKDLPRSCFLLTFDDGFREIYDIIAPILLDKGIPAVFFISSAFLDNKELCYEHKASLLVERMRRGISAETQEKIRKALLKIGLWSSELYKSILEIDYSRREVLDGIAEIVSLDFDRYLRENKPYLTSGQVKELVDLGFGIGAHSIDHPYYSGLSLLEQLKQTIVSVKEVREKFNLDYGAFAFPHNDFGVCVEFFDKIRESGLVDITFGTGGMVQGSERSHRQRSSLEKPLMPARELIAWQYVRSLYRKLVRYKRVAGLRGKLREIQT
jgi:peptidoglycan/xylan/chitin deacetylase (PgdA/CDA1 family)